MGLSTKLIPLNQIVDQMQLRFTASAAEKLILITELLLAGVCSAGGARRTLGIMVCSFCGTDNRAENRFCGMCGVRLERRMADRRTNRDVVQLNCPSCSHVNEAGYKFCGQCGARIDRRINDRRGTGVTDVRATAGANASLPTPDDSRPRKSSSGVALSGERESDLLSPPPSPSPNIFVNDARREELRREELRREDFRREDVRRDELRREDLRREDLRREDLRRNEAPSRPDLPINRSEQTSRITGPSFLGLGNDSDSEGEYLLEDESSRGSGVRKFILLVVLAAIVGLIFMQWRSSLKANPKTPEPAPSSAPRGKATTPPSSPLPGQEQNQSSDPATVSAFSSKNSDDPGKAGDTSSPSKNDQTEALKNVHDEGILPAATDTNRSETAKLNDSPKPESSASSESSKSTDAKPGGSTSNAAKADASKSAVVDPATVDPATPARPSTALLRAQQFLQGRGVPQNCEQGLIYLRAAAQKNEPAAAVQMGALYSAGHCVRQDRVMAYRWFNSAHELQPANQWIQKSMDQLWSQMSEQERRLSGY